MIYFKSCRVADLEFSLWARCSLGSEASARRKQRYLWNLSLGMFCSLAIRRQDGGLQLIDMK